MRFFPNERMAVFIDGANLYATSKTLGFDIDYKKFLNKFGQHNLVRMYYYTAISENEEYSSIRPLIDWLDYNGYTVVTKPIKEFFDSMGRRKVKGSMDIDIAVDAMALSDHVEHIVLVSGDGDFRRLVEALQRKGRRVTVISTITTQPPMVSDDLRRQADQFVDINDLAGEIGRPAIDRPARETKEGGFRRDFRSGAPATTDDVVET